MNGQLRNIDPELQELLFLNMDGRLVPLSSLFNGNDKLQASFDFPPFPPPKPQVPRLTDLSADDINSIKDGLLLIEIIARHFHNIKPKPYIIKGEGFFDDEIYNVDKAAEALEIAQSSLKLYHTESQGFKIYKEPGKGHRYSGYEIARFYLKRKLNSFSLEDLSNMLYISEQVTQRLVELKVLKIRKGIIEHDSLLEFFDQVFPRKGHDTRYSHVMDLKHSGSAVAYKSAVVSDSPTVSQPVAKEDNGIYRGPINPSGAAIADETIKPSEASQQTPVSSEKKGATIESMVVSSAYYPNEEKVYKSLSAVPKWLTEAADYKLAPRLDKPYDDTFSVRHWDLNSPRKTRPDNLQVSWRDIKMVMLAKSCDDEQTIKKAFEERELPFDREYVVESMKKAGQPTIIYKNKTVFVPGTVQIVAELSPEEIEIIGEYAKPLIAKYGPLISLKQMSQLLGSNFTQTDFLRTKRKEIAFVKINDEPMYNLFQVVRAYLPAFEKTSSKPF